MDLENIIRSIIKEEGLIRERLMDVDEDVNMLYDMYFKDDIEEVKREDYISNNNFTPTTTSTEILKTDLAKKAHELNPCDIGINYWKKGWGNFYVPENDIISLTISKGAVEYIRNDHMGRISRGIEYLEPSQNAKQLKKEFKEETLKGTIHHELAHWIDDTLHNRHIKKTLSKPHEARWGEKNVNSTFMEIQAQIHNIKQLKNKFEGIWDAISFDSMIEMSRSLTTVKDMLSGEEKREWLKNIYKRMAREGLLGKNMKL